MSKYQCRYCKGRGSVKLVGKDNPCGHCNASGVIEIEDGGTAFPTGDFIYGGMTLRDYFAAKAMQAMISKSSGQDQTGGAKGVPLIAKFSYEFADAMLKAREA